MTETLDRREQRLAKLQLLRDQGFDPYPARVSYTHTCAEAPVAFEAAAPDVQIAVAVVGRLVAVRDMGKSTFAHLADGSGRLQIYLRQDDLGVEAYSRFRHAMDLGDHLRAEGYLFRTRTGEVTVHVAAWQPLSKALESPPEKWHGLRDVETRYRQRYLDLMANADVRDIFVRRTRIISALRRLLDARGFLEVETPVLQPLYGGAAARPFTTHHNTLDRTLYLRIADELYLKRLIVGGLDRVYEIGHNFRNEGIDTQHNPEFTVMELYQAYADYHDMMRLAEEVYSAIAIEVTGSATISYQGQGIDLTPPWRRVTMRDAILEHSGVDVLAQPTHEALASAVRAAGLDVPPQQGWGKLVERLFQECVEPTLIQPTFITDFPLEVSPLAKRKAGSDNLVERFEFYIGTLECGNAFSELNDPLDQRERFAAQARARQAGDDEAHPMDEDFLTAMEHGMPPTGGLGCGLDRFVMLLTDQASIREVILFPQMRGAQSAG